jgi:drug/metabolite transporter (DMT)-like permease
LDSVLVAVVLLSAALHAGWNAAARAQDHPDAFSGIILASAIWGLAALSLVGLPAAASLPWLALGIVTNVVGMRLVLAAYERTGFAIAYPVARGLAPPFVLIGVGFATAEWPGLLGVFGLGLVSVSVLIFARIAAKAGQRDLTGLLFAVGGALTAAGYIVSDVIGVRLSGDPVAYLVLISIANGVVFAALQTWEGRKPWRFVLERPLVAFGWSIASNLSYIIVLYGFTVASPALVAALRETSVLFAAAFATLFLKERLVPMHWLAIVVALAGVVAIRLA